MQEKSQRGLSNKKQKNSSRPNSSNPLNRNSSNQQTAAKNRPFTAKIPNQNQHQNEKLHFQLKINPLNSNNKIRPTRPTSSATDRVFNKYWENKTPKATNLQSISKFEFTGPKGESLITNELLVDFHKKQKSIFNRGLYKYNKIDWESKKNINFLSTVGGLEIKSNKCILNTPMQNYETFSINSTAIASRPQSNTGNDLFGNAKNQFGFQKDRPLTGFQIKSKNHVLRLHSAKLGNNEDFDNDANFNSDNNNINYDGIYDEYANGFYSGNDPANSSNRNNSGKKRPLTGNVNKRGNALRPFSAASNKLA